MARFCKLALLVGSPVLAQAASAVTGIPHADDDDGPHPDDGEPILKLMNKDTTELVLIAAGPFLLIGLASLAFVFGLRASLLSKPTGTDVDEQLGKGKGKKIDYLATKVKSGAISFLREEYKYLGVYVLFWFVVLIIMFSVKRIDESDSTDGIRCAACFLVGALLSGGAGWLGMSVATDGNVRTTVACATKTLNDGLRVAFTAGAAMGFGVTGLASVGMALMMICMSPNRDAKKTMQYLHSFGFGASSIALFARVAGGIYTKAADVGADLVGKVEAGIDEDDPHNPAVIADNVGDNVGDVAGMGADLFESYFGSIIAGCTLGATHAVVFGNGARLALPLWLAAAGQLSSFIGFFFVSTDEKGDGWNTDLGKLMFALEKGMYVANILFMILGAVIIGLLFGFDSEAGWKMYGCVFIGLITGMIIGKGTEYFTSFDFGPTKSITDRARTGPATVIIQGMGVGMISTVLPTVVLAVAIVACAELAEEYGVALAAVGMLATLAISLSTDAYGPIADNAGGLAEMGGLGAAVRAKTDSLDALGNTTAAIGKGFAVGSAVLTALSLLAAFKEEVTHNTTTDLTFEVDSPIVLAGVLVGAMLPYLFGALTMISVGKAAAEMIEEVRRQFREVKNAKGRTLMEAIRLASQGEELIGDDDVEPDSDRCVMISTRSSVKEMLAPGMYAVLSPLTIGLLIGPRCVMGLLAGTIGSAAMLAVMMGNAGGAWDNSKKLCEKLGIKKTEQGKACVVGDTVGDPYKDTSGPSLDILLKLMAMVALLIAPLMNGKDDWEDWYFGLVPLLLGVGGTAALMYTEVLTWKDPLGGKVEGNNNTGGWVAPEQPAKADAAVEKTPVEPMNGAAWTEDNRSNTIQ